MANTTWDLMKFRNFKKYTYISGIGSRSVSKDSLRSGSTTVSITSEFDARKRELYFKTTSGKKALKFMLNKTFDTLGYKGSKIEMGYDD